MFDIGPSELLVIFVVALLVIGPERLPAAVKTASLWIGRFRRSFHKIKADVERELNADEIRRQLHNESILAEVEDAKKQAQDLASSAERAAVEELGLERKTEAATPSESGESAGSESTAAADNQSTDNPAQTAAADSNSTAPGSTAAGDSAGRDSKPSNSAEPTVGGELKQAVNYVNDISREVKASTKEIEEKIKNPGFASSRKSGDKQ